MQELMKGRSVQLSTHTVVTSKNNPCRQSRAKTSKYGSFQQLSWPAKCKIWSLRPHTWLVVLLDHLKLISPAFGVLSAATFQFCTRNVVAVSFLLFTVVLYKLLPVPSRRSVKLTFSCTCPVAYSAAWLQEISITLSSVTVSHISYSRKLFCKVPVL